MITYKLHKDPYDCEILFSGKLERSIDTGLNVLVGCNGSGKTTILRYIEEKYQNDENYKVFHWDGLTDKRYQKDRMLDAQQFDMLASLAFSSEGEEINLNMGILASQIGNFVRSNKDKDVIILLDGIDSGLSVDNIVDLKNFFDNLLIPDITKSGHKCYIVVTANEYELARGEKCIDARSGKEIKFEDYEHYRTYILESRERKDNRKQTRNNNG